jgi:endonuclease-3
MNKNKHYSKRLDSILKELAKLYPNPRSELNFNNPYELVVAVALSAQCTDKKVNEVTRPLFKLYPSFLALSKAKLDDIEKCIKQVNYYKSKAKNILLMAQMVTNQFKGILPTTHDELVTLPGVGNKTANVVLSELDIQPAFPVDTHVFRVSKRLNLSTGANVKVVEEQLKKKFEPKLWRPLHHWLIFHGRRVCKAQNPNCSECTISKLCPSRTKLK